MSLEEQFKYDRRAAIEEALKIISRPFVVFDTETTGLHEDAEIVEIAIISGEGAVLLDTLLRPTVPIPSDATAIHGNCNDDVIGRPILLDYLHSISSTFRWAVGAITWGLTYVCSGNLLRFLVTGTTTGWSIQGAVFALCNCAPSFLASGASITVRTLGSRWVGRPPNADSTLKVKSTGR